MGLVFHGSGLRLGLREEVCKGMRETRTEVGLAVKVVQFLGSVQLENMDISNTENKIQRH